MAAPDSPVRPPEPDVIHSGFDRCAEAILVFDRNRTLACNEAATRLFGCTAAELRALSAFQLSPPNQPDGSPSGPAIVGRFAEARQDGSVRFPWRFRRPGGGDVTTLVSLSTFPFEGALAYWATVTETTAKTRAVQPDAAARPAAPSPATASAVPADDVQLDRFFTLSSDLLCVTDGQGRLLRLNAAWERTLGHAGGALDGRTFFELLHGDDVAAARVAWARLTDSGRVVSLEHRFACRDGSWRWLAWSASLDPERRRGYVIARDVTVTKRTEIELRRARDAAESGNRAKSEFLAAMSHEIRTPLNAVLGIASLMRESSEDTEQRELIDTILSSGRGLLDIVNEVLDFSKAEAGRLELAIGPVEPRLLVEDTCELLAEHAQRRGLELVVDLGDLPQRFPGDGARIRQVLTNLVGNAIKFTEHGVVEVSVRADTNGAGAGRLRLEVRDTGIGIPAADQARIFEPFKQVDSALSRRHDGTGLGLAISRRLAELMHGTIGVESRPGEGSRFWFEVPFPESVPADSTAAGEFTGRRAIVLDRCAATRAAIVRALARRGFDARDADNVAAAQTAIGRRGADGRPPLVIVERAWPVAVQAAERWRADGAVAVIELRTRLDAVSAAESRVGVAKPARAEALVAAARRALGGPAAVPAVAGAGAGAATVASAPHLLLVEDNPVNQMIAMRMLRKLGCQADLASNGREAIEAVGRQVYDVVLMDCQMPDVDGFEATRAIRAAEQAGTHQTVIAMTALAMNGDRERCLAAGMDDYLPKPVQIDTLRQVLQRWTTSSAQA